jgi:large subunit ribosomal protein L29
VKPEKIREMSDEDIHARERELREQLFRLRLQQAVGQLDDAVKIRNTRREIARVITIMKEKQGSATPRS